MLIQFQNMETKILPNFKGGEKEMAAKMHVDDQNKIMCLTLQPGASVGLHTHETDCEIVYILKGTGKALYDGGEERLEPSVCHYCPKGHEHSIVNDSDEDLVFFAVVCAQ